ncbi:DUF1642 domain-containing protein [Lactococcus garvieae]|uniref:DUF1642 domain-containing protein n=1 Tax=Lactococcus garvieae TaxID=1363 RepID=UPI001BCAE027|nr:DUF1642 domain-containing protein [Lactococcus garvieae]MBS4463486.1 DUF1642 domain-containing protein [Lactococcus garvieae]
MTKFEEEVKRPKKAYIDPFSKRDVDFTGVAKKFTEGAQTLKEWKEYAFLLEDKLKLQQQALPFVPEFVAEWIEILKTKGLKPLKNPETYGETGFTEEKLQNIVFWISEHQEDYMRAWLDGYTVEKPQLFYLKNKIELEDVGSDLIGYLNLFLTNGGYLTSNINLAKKFTQEEIDSMQTGSYEQIKVEEEK